MMGRMLIIRGHCCDPHWTKGLLSTLPLVLAVLIETVEVGGSCVYFFLSTAFTYLYYLYLLRKDNSINTLKIFCDNTLTPPLMAYQIQRSL